MLWDDRIFSFEDEEKKKELNLYSWFAVETLLATEGSPSDWYTYDEIESENINYIGLRDGMYGYVNYDKVIHLIEMSDYYEEIKKLIGLSGYEFSINITITDGSENNSAFIGYKGDCSKTTRITRFATDNKKRIYKINYEGCIAK